MQSTFQRTITSKPFVVGFIALLLLIPLSMIESKVKERSFFRGTVIADVSESWASNQTLMGPVVVLEYQVAIKEMVWNKKEERTVTSTRLVHRTAMLPMHHLNVKANLDTEKRYRGIYGVPVYSTQVSIEGTIDPSGVRQVFDTPGFDHIKRSYLWINTTDQRGFLDIPTLNWHGTESPFTAGGHDNLSNRGIIVKLPENDLVQTELSINLNLRGTQSLAFIPTGKSTSISVQSAWPHPKFTGRYLPVTRSISEGGFSAHWNITQLASSIHHDLASCSTGVCEQLLNNQLGVSLIEPIDVYVMTERAVKYGILYVVLVFVLVLASELYRSMDIHPIQYLMVGVGVSVFYLLLLALSEHIDFILAYAIATLMCSSLLTYYGVQIFRTMKAGIAFGLVIASLYALLLVILLSEDIALLLGSIIIFFAVMLLMVTTRNAERLRLWLPGQQDQ